MSRPAVIVVDDDSALLTGVTSLMEFHLPDVRVKAFESIASLSLSLSLKSRTWRRSSPISK
jgi:FixJ family two-component response regulator